MSRISYFTDMEKSVVTANFIKRGWTSATSDEEWNFYWYTYFSLKNIINSLVLSLFLLLYYEGQTPKPVAVCSRLKVHTVLAIISNKRQSLVLTNI